MGCLLAFLNLAGSIASLFEKATNSSVMENGRFSLPHNSQYNPALPNIKSLQYLNHVMMKWVTAVTTQQYRTMSLEGGTAVPLHCVHLNPNQNGGNA